MVDTAQCGSKRDTPVGLALWLIFHTTICAQLAAEVRDTDRSVRRIPDVMYVPTPHDVAKEMLALANVRRSDVVYDLGCGDGRIPVIAAKQHGCRAVGIDIDPLRIEDARKNVRENHVEHLVTIREGDLFKVDLTDATLVVVYLSTKYNTQLLPQLRRMKPGSRIVSHQFTITGIKPDKTVSVRSEDHRAHDLLLWTSPLR